MIAIISTSAKLMGVCSALLLGICDVETNLRNVNNLKDGGSPSYGVCQVKRITEKHMSEIKYLPKCKGKRDLTDPEFNSCIAAKYLAYQLKRYNGNIDKAISAYNAGRAVPFNKQYVTKVKKRKKKYLASL